jgi:hypothetical protein
MRNMSFRIVMFLAASLFATGLTAQVDNKDYDLGGGGAVSCKTCSIDAYSTPGVMVERCITPDSGSIGHQSCYIQSSSTGAYCFVEGDSCCVD